MTASLPLASERSSSWRTPAVIVLCGCLVSLLSFGPRAVLGLFLNPQSQANDWGRDVFGLAIALQNIIWGIAQPFAGMLADRFGTLLVFCAGTAAGSFGQFLYAPATVALMGIVGWQETLVIFAATMLLVLPLSIPLSTAGSAELQRKQAPQQSLREAL